jgi:quercetin dioxygenase-like cupin family protein
MSTAGGLHFLAILAVAVATRGFGQTVLSEPPPNHAALLIPVASNPEDQQAMRYSVVYSDANGVTHFRNEGLAWQATQGAQGLQNFVTPYVSAQTIGFLRIAKHGWSDWHPAPSKRFVMVLSGLLELEVGDGERRTFGPGNVLLVTDAEGRGHLTNVLGSEDVFLVWVPVP